MSQGLNHVHVQTTFDIIRSFLGDWKGYLDLVMLILTWIFKRMGGFPWLVSSHVADRKSSRSAGHVFPKRRVLQVNHCLRVSQIGLMSFRMRCPMASLLFEWFCCHCLCQNDSVITVYTVYVSARPKFDLNQEIYLYTPCIYSLVSLGSAEYLMSRWNWSEPTPLMQFSNFDFPGWHWEAPSAHL